MTKTTMSVSELATYLGVSTDTIYRMVRKKQIPNTRVRGRIFFRKKVIDEWMRKSEEESYQVG
ncbi:helix-turn-helix domain-containing protein [Brevibacillus laterosporus]|uniref:Helix-turn-helix domain-containing protein n=1 Tax=Brevibacillus halotolerans TaxID=1507437 RepID=A0ABT4HYA0_9BACL|nr:MULTISPECIES: helix-turn-helix domain-containing protein [Brevibacillus]MCR8986040.1 helix-turn-helix domain-containing protein [Brevibacillus laterosporus]MCZ0831773.1 helix-turn-helix domain-containing protein [Brevibacillus halotolerans]